MVLKTSPLSNFAMGFSLGYFTIDLVILFWHYPAVSHVGKGVVMPSLAGRCMGIVNQGFVDLSLRWQR